MDHLLVRVVTALCDDVATPRAALVKEHVLAREWTKLLELRVKPSDYECPEAYFKDSLVTDLLRKCDFKTDIDKEAAARRTFVLCEQRNAATNARLSRFLPETLFLETPADERVYQFITGWRKDVSQAIGRLPDHLTPRFSGGATYGDTGLYKTTPDKMSNVPQITKSARCLLPYWMETSWWRTLSYERPSHCDPLTVRGNKFFTVPKDAEKRRGCCKEPSLNIALQLDVGRLLKVRLRERIGIDLKDGQELHRKLAQKASYDGSLATIDMSNASDTVCRLLPRLVLPADWHSLLDSLRSAFTRMDKRWYRLEKFSSMGNGFTFELESLLFVTLARKIVADEGGDPGLVKCYGDDLIVPTEHTKSVLAALAFFGFEPNEKKTFWEGPFRESCGGDFFNGVPVRAHFLEELPDEPHKWISLANGLRRVAFSNGERSPRWDYIRRAWLRCLDALPSNIRRCRGPEHLGDIVIHDVEAEWSTTEIRPRRRYIKHRTPEGSETRIVLDDASGESVEAVFSWQPVNKVLAWHHWKPTVQLACTTLGYESSGITPRGAISGYRIVRVPSRLTCDWLPQYIELPPD